MNIRSAQKASELLEEKIKYETDLSKLLSNDCEFSLHTEYKRSLHFNSFALNISKNKDFNRKIKELVMDKLEEEIARIDEEIKQLKCE